MYRGVHALRRRGLDSAAAIAVEKCARDIRRSAVLFLWCDIAVQWSRSPTAQQFGRLCPISRASVVSPGGGERHPPGHLSQLRRDALVYPATSRPVRSAEVSTCTERSASSWLNRNHGSQHFNTADLAKRRWWPPSLAVAMSEAAAILESVKCSRDG